ncbi:hypothetical protein B0T24DRAFT_11422 [Lasiosphaeria ovina]|uniref:Uncharacterized protein n=1 Tax=Lasiosphaeria ovina TaxID=92902 RepID=A0AAE0NIZ6_9PEZI|nr:hypothetical protein B0T24DRAFT_11422 [Lasiosphaeria ovina]
MSQNLTYLQVGVIYMVRMYVCPYLPLHTVRSTASMTCRDSFHPQQRQTRGEFEKRGKVRWFSSCFCFCFSLFYLCFCVYFYFCFYCCSTTSDFSLPYVAKVLPTPGQKWADIGFPGPVRARSPCCPQRCKSEIGAIPSFHRRLASHRRQVWPSHWAGNNALSRRQA